MVNVRLPQSRVWKWALVIGGFLLLLIILSYLINIKVLRQYAERRMNQNLTDYTVRVGKAFFLPIGMSLTLDDLVLIQNDNPEPPVAKIQRLHAGIHWRALIKGRLVGDLLIEQPQLYINLQQARKEVTSATNLAQKGWQDALMAVYPLQINVLKVNNGELTYIDEGPNPPLQASAILLHATNIRNIFTPDQTYPSPVIASAVIFDQGQLHLDGHANFLQKPRLGFKGQADLRDIDLGYFKPIMQRQNMAIRQGALSATGRMEFAAKKSEIHLETIELTGLDADYDLRPETEAKQQQQVQQATKAAREMSNAPTAIIKVDLVKITRGTRGYFNQTTDPKIRIYADHIEATVQDFSNQLAEGSSAFQLHGRFLGSGATEITGTFRPEIVNLIRNAFFQAILPGFEQEVNQQQQS